MVTLDATFYDLHKYKSIKSHPNYLKLGSFYTSFYVLRPIVLLYLTYRLGKLFAHTSVEQWKGNHNFLETILNEERYYKDFFVDSVSNRAVNFRFHDHEDKKSPDFSHYSHDVFKADADYCKGLIKHFRERYNNM